MIGFLLRDGGQAVTVNADKRTVATDALETLGTILPGGEGRDAIHLAVEPVVAAHPLEPGEHVGFLGGAVGKCSNPLGIVDPFLKGTVWTGDRFWLVVYPRTITSLRHVWTHPAFDTPAVETTGLVSVAVDPPPKMEIAPKSPVPEWDDDDDGESSCPACRS